jgi:DNA-binding HxlR family transcriptional regulator
LRYASANVVNNFYFASGFEFLLMKEYKKRSECPVSCSLDIWGDKWSLLIIRDLMFAKQCTYGDFLKSGEKIATNILASRLQTLEENGLITKSDHPDSKAKVLYKLSQKGIDLLPIMVEINLWADTYFSLSADRKAQLDEIKKDKEKFIQSAKEELKSALS